MFLWLSGQCQHIDRYAYCLLFCGHSSLPFGTFPKGHLSIVASGHNFSANRVALSEVGYCTINCDNGKVR